ncbi:MFS family permease [Saccharothrix tamanrassetensis]|uniref:MFS family permease n=1 Tax=Saccharothrix tamanrassetensis TaxID=1051531 RepID=A0A841CHT1_9PSEU|nr:MFS transporter [Saccharothrix tamanrassetensis]MBB5958092.1 MFS family permease [Saccharothrix tamanrassetensis]
MSGVFEPLRTPAFRRLITGRGCAELANAVAPVALAFAVLDLTGSLVDLGIVVGARSAAVVVLVLFGGMLADRLPRSVILQGTALTAALTQGLVAASVLGHFASLPLLVGLGIANGATAAMSLPAAAALTPQTVAPALLTQANALARIGVNTGRFSGAALGGLLVGSLGPGWAIAGNAVLFLLAALAYQRVRVAHPPRVVEKGVLGDLVEGWREFTEHTWVWVVVLQFMVVNAVLAGGLFVLGPSIANHTIGRTAWGFVIAAETLGALIGGVLVARWRPRRALFVGVSVILLEALPLVVLAEWARVVPLLLAMFAVGLTTEVFVVAWDVSLQENIAPEKLARVYSYDMLGSFIALPVGEVVAGPLATRFGVETTLLAGAVVLVIVTCGALCSRQVRTLTRRADQEDVRT